MVNYMNLSKEDEDIIKTAVHLVVNETRANPLQNCLNYPDNLMFVIRNIKTSHGLQIEDKTLRALVEPLVRLAWIDFGSCKDLFDFPSQEWFRFLERRLRI